jgi:hypothetical protein
MLIQINASTLPFVLSQTASGRTCFEDILDLSDPINRTQLSSMRSGDLLVGVNGYNVERCDVHLCRSLLATPSRPLQCTFVRPIQAVLEKSGTLGLSLASFETRVYVNSAPVGQSKTSAIQKGMILMDVQSTNVTRMPLPDVLSTLKRAGRPLYLTLIATKSNDHQLQQLLTNAAPATESLLVTTVIPGPPPKTQRGIAAVSASPSDSIPGPPPKNKRGISASASSSTSRSCQNF